MLDFLLDIIFPRFCLGCGKIGKYFCDRCRNSIRFYSPLISPNYKKIPYIDGIFVLAHYDGVIRKAIKEVKYRGKYNIFSEIAPLIKPQFQFDFLVPVPLSKNRLQKRGFNQSEKLARELVRIWNLEDRILALDCLERILDTKPQFELTREERLKNVKNAFSLNSKFNIQNSVCCLVDDVATTGSTLSECAKVLKQSGAKKVFAICIARGN